MRKSIQIYREILNAQDQELGILKTKASYEKAKHDLKRLEDMDTKQMIKFIAEKLITIEQMLSSL